MKFLLPAMAALLLLASCHSSKKVPARPVYRPDKALTDNNYTRTLVEEAYSWLGTPYKWAGESKSGTDCSGFMMKVYDKALGIKLPRNSRAQADYCTDIDPRELVVGDLVFFKTNGTGQVSHVGMYVGDGHFIHASSSRGVTVSSLQENYYVAHLHHCGRVDRYGAMISKVPLAPAHEIAAPAIPDIPDPVIPDVEEDTDLPVAVPDAKPAKKPKTKKEATQKPSKPVKADDPEGGSSRRKTARHH